MSSQQQQPSILMVGLPLNGPAPPGADPSLGEKVKAGIAAAREHMRQESVAIDMLLLGPTDDRAPFGAKLAEKQYGALIIGGGVKTLPHCNELLEYMVNETKDNSPATRIFFVAGPDTILDTAKRASKAVKV